jgi:uncharacterized protein (TIGR03083 family)
MDNERFLALLEQNGRRFAAACEAAGFDARVPPCPDWNVDDLAWHLLGVLYFWRTIVGEQLDTWEKVVEPTHPGRDVLLASFNDELDATLRTFREADLDAIVWTWTGPQKPSWHIRRMAQETAVHRWDAESAAGETTPIDAELASDGIDEFLEFFVGGPTGSEPVGGTVHLHCTDVPGEWLVRESSDGFEFTREHAKGDCAIRGAASDLLLVLWRRLPLSTVDVVGDEGVAARFVGVSPLT